jgi:hypothetical protein
MTKKNDGNPHRDNFERNLAKQDVKTIPIELHFFNTTTDIGKEIMFEQRVGHRLL